MDFLEFPHWPIFNLADSSIVCAGVLVVLLTLRGITLDGRSSRRLTERRTRRTTRDSLMSDQRALPVPDGLEGERVDVALTRLFGLSRSRAAELVRRGAVQLDGASAGQVGPRARRVLARGRPARPAAGAARCAPRRSTAW